MGIIILLPTRSGEMGVSGDRSNTPILSYLDTKVHLKCIHSGCYYKKYRVGSMRVTILTSAFALPKACSAGVSMMNKGCIVA